MMKNKLLLLIGVLLACFPAPARAQTTPAAETCTPNAYALPGEFVVPESITYEKSTNKFYVGSAAEGTIFSGTVGDAGSVRVFSPAAADGRAGALGMEVDKKGRLFVAGSRTGQIFVYDTKTTALIAKFDTIAATGVSASKTGFPHNLTDMALTPNGDVFVTDAFLPYLYRVYEGDGGKLAMEVFLDFTGTAIAYQTPVALTEIRSMEDNVSSFNLNAIEATPDGKFLILGQTNVGKLYRLSLTDKTITSIDLGGKTVRADDILLDGDLLYINAIVDTGMSATTPTAIMIARLTPDFTAGTIVKTYTDPAFLFQTSFVFVDGCLLATNSQLLGFFTRQFKLPFTVVSIPIPTVEK